MPELVRTQTQNHNRARLRSRVKLCVHSKSAARLLPAAHTSPLASERLSSSSNPVYPNQASLRRALER